MQIISGYYDLLHGELTGVAAISGFVYFDLTMNTHPVERGSPRSHFVEEFEEVIRPFTAHLWT